MKISECCEAEPVLDSDDLGICPECKEHCEYIENVENCLRCGDQLDDELVLCNNCCTEAIDALAEKEKGFEWTVELEKLNIE